MEVLTSDQQVKLVNISTSDIVDGNPKLTLGLVWCIILHWQVCNIKATKTNNNILALKHLLATQTLITFDLFLLFYLLLLLLLLQYLLLKIH